MRARTLRHLPRHVLQKCTQPLSVHSLLPVTGVRSEIERGRRRGLQMRKLSVNASGMKYCRNCGHHLTDAIPPGDTRQRLMCLSCGYIEYQNPKLVVGCIVEHDDRILMCSRGIEPCKGLWTLPAGYLEIGESLASGAARETLEEANAVVSITSMFSMMDVPVIGQCHVMFRASLRDPYHHSPGVETLQTKLIVPEEIEMDEIAFTSMRETIKAYKTDRQEGRFRFHHGVIARRPEASPSDSTAYTLENYVVQ